MINILRKIIHDLLMVLAPTWLKRKLMSCQEISLILNDSPPQSLSQKAMFKMHLFICQCCTNYKDQLSLIDKSSKSLQKVSLSDEELKKIEQAKQKVLNKLHN